MNFQSSVEPEFKRMNKVAALSSLLNSGTERIVLPTNLLAYLLLAEHINVCMSKIY